MIARVVRVGLVAAAAALAPISSAWAQAGAVPEAKDLVHATAAPVTLPAGGRTHAKIALTVREGWHVNANPPALDYLIPTVVTLTGAGGIRSERVTYPPGKKEQLSFEKDPLLVYDGESEVTIRIGAEASAAQGPHTLHGKVSFQSCNNEVCLAPASVPFDIVVTVAGVATAPPGPDTTAAGAASDTVASLPGQPSGTGFTSAPPAQGATAAVVDNPIARMLAGGSLAAFLGLFAIGLALNLTPCVYPMLGVTVSIFGARRAAPPLQVFGLAAVYVLGMAVMYSTLGVVAAFTGGLFGGALQSPIVLVVIGVLLAALALSMFGLYELQPPPWMLERAGGAGTTSIVGIFLSGLMVGVIAAPCIGPPVVALLAVVGAKGDPWFGFKSFFTLAMGLGAPYLVLGTFSNLLQRLPRSGDWMVWVKKVFGVIMLSVGAFYVLLALAPRLSNWVVPVALIAGGLYLGFVDRSVNARPGFRWLKWAVGVLGLAGGIGVIATTPAPGIVFAPFDRPAVAAALKSGSPVLLDFTANWCAPCHELERFTFSDKRVKEAMRRYRAFGVDVTHFDSPEVERLRREYAIRGVPSVLFIAPDGTEARAARVEGFLKPEEFLERVRMAEATRAAN